jgi:hypothetical protein
MEIKELRDVEEVRDWGIKPRGYPTPGHFV